MAWLAKLDITSVWPSGAAAATRALPRVAPAPGRFSMTRGWPSRSRKPWATRRAARSVVPPGAKGTMRRIGCEGHAVAADADDPRVPTAHTTANTPGSRAAAERAAIAKGASIAARRDKPPD